MFKYLHSQTYINGGILLSSLKLNKILFWTFVKVQKLETVFSGLRTDCVQAILIFIIRFASKNIHFDAYRCTQYILKASTVFVANNCSKVDPIINELDRDVCLKSTRLNTCMCFFWTCLFLNIVQTVFEQEQNSGDSV